MINYYDVLNVPFNATEDEIKRSFRKLVKLYHPDISKKLEKEKLNLVLVAYEVLSNEEKRSLFDYEFFGKVYSIDDNKIRLSKNRVRYSRALTELAKSGLLKKNFTRRDWNFHFKHDITIYITPSENSIGCIAVFDLPIKKLCPYCRGSERRCYFCDGIGRINSMQTLEVIIPKDTKHESIIEVDLLKACRVKFASYTLKYVKIKICILGKENERTGA